MLETIRSPRDLDGMSYEKMIDRLIETAEQAHADKNQAVYAYTSDILKGAAIGSKGSKGTKGIKG